MNSVQPSESKVTEQRLTTLYVIALTALGLLSLATQGIVQRAIAQQRDDSSLINTAGRQRMLSQRIAKAALAYRDAADDGARSGWRAQLEESAGIFDASQQALQQRDSAHNLGGENSAPVAVIFSEIEPARQTIVASARELVSNDRADPERDAHLSDAILAAEPVFLAGMERIVSQYEHEASERVAELRRIEQLSLSAFLLVLVLEALFIFRPGVANIRRAIRQLEQVQADHAETSLELRTIFDSVPALILHSDRDGKVLRVNASGAKIIGEEPAALLGACVYDLFSGQEARLREEDREIFRARAPQLGLLHYVKNSQGETRWLRMNKIPHANQGAEIDGVISFGVDVSEHKRLERRLMELRSEEERRLGYNLHDGLGQELSGILYLGRRLLNRMRGASQPEADQAAELLEMVKRCIESVRDLSKTLRPIGDEPDALSRSLRELADNTRETAEMDCRVDERGTVFIFEHDVAEHLYRIAQEAVNNAVRHSGAKELRIRLSQGDDETVLEIEDDGRGLDTAHWRSERSHGRDPEGLGLSIMEHRAELIGGRFQITSRPGAGTRVRCAISV